MEQLSIISHNKYKVISIKGDIVEKHLDPIRKALNEILVSNNLFVALDLKEVEYVNSIVIGTFLVYYKKFLSKGGDLCFISPHPSITPVLEALGINQIIKFYNSVDQLPQ